MALSLSCQSSSIFGDVQSPRTQPLEKVSSVSKILYTHQHVWVLIGIIGQRSGRSRTHLLSNKKPTRPTSKTG